MLEDMAALVEEAGDWREHVPYDAALNYHESDDVRSMWREHVDSCSYCQRMIDTLHPNLEELHAIRIVNDFVEHPDHLVELERSDNPHDKIKAADVYFAMEHAEFAYERLGEGLKSLFSLDTTVQDRISHAFRLPEEASTALIDAAVELRTFFTQPPFSPEQVLSLFETYARLGQHRRAISSLCAYLIKEGASPREVADVRRDLNSIASDLRIEDGVEAFERSVSQSATDKAKSA